GYGFLFAAQPDTERARKLRNEAYRTAAVSIPLAYDATDNVARTVAERIAVNAREANITLQTFGEKNLTLDSAVKTGAQVVLVRLPMASAALATSLTDLEMQTGFPLPVLIQAESASSSESIYASERAALESFRV